MAASLLSLRPGVLSSASTTFALESVIFKEFMVSFYLFLFLFINFREREEKGREGEREGETERVRDLLFHLFLHSSGDSSLCPDWESNLQPQHSGRSLTSWDNQLARAVLVSFTLKYYFKFMAWTLNMFVAPELVIINHFVFFFVDKTRKYCMCIHTDNYLYLKIKYIVCFFTMPCQLTVSYGCYFFPQG